VPKKTPKVIVEESLPDMEVAEAAPADTKRAAKDLKPGPSLEALRKKYLGSDSVDESAQADGAGGADDEDDVEVTKVRSKKRHADPVDDPGPRTVIISKSKGILGSQG
jgi:hypothetical protein